MSTPNFNDLDRRAAQAFARDAYRQAREAAEQRDELLEACKAARDFICTDGVCDSCGGSLKDGELPPHTGCVCGPILGALKKAGVSDR